MKNMVRHTREPQLALLLPLAISQGWSVRKFATTAQIDTNEAGRLLKEASRNAITALGELESVDALSLTVKLGNEDVTLGKIQGKMVSGAVRSLGRLPSDPDQWDESNDKTYRRCQTVLRDAKALGLIRFGEADKAGTPPALRHIDPFTARSEGRKQGKGEKSPTESASVNDGASRCTPDPAPDTPPDTVESE
jgi:hypothetical protein